MKASKSLWELFDKEWKAIPQDEKDQLVRKVLNEAQLTEEQWQLMSLVCDTPVEELKQMLKKFKAEVNN